MAKFDMNTVQTITSQLRCLTRWEFEYDISTNVWRHVSKDLCAIWDMEMQVGSYSTGEDEIFLIRSWCELENTVEYALPDLY